MKERKKERNGEEGIKKKSINREKRKALKASPMDAFFAWIKKNPDCTRH